MFSATTFTLPVIYFNIINDLSSVYLGILTCRFWPFVCVSLLCTNLKESLPILGCEKMGCPEVILGKEAYFSWPWLFFVCEVGLADLQGASWSLCFFVQALPYYGNILIGFYRPCSAGVLIISSSGARFYVLFIRPWKKF